MRKMQIIESSPNPCSVRPLDDRAPGARPMFALKRADLRDLNLIGWAICAFVMTIVYTSVRVGGERDFVYFYSLGHLLNHYSPARLYDFALQQNIADAFQPEPLKGGYFGALAYPPYLAMFFQPFAMLPYWTACRLWLAISLALYVTGLCLLIRRFCDADILHRSLFLLFGLSFYPIIPWVLLGGQVSAVGFLAMALAVCWEASERHFLSGIALSICTYKPTLLILILPMLLVIRRPKTLAGFATGALTLVAVATLAAGPRIWMSYVAASSSFAATISHVLPVTLDVRALATAVPHAGLFTRGLFVCAGGLAGACLAGTWWRARKYSRHSPATLTWATTITWTLLLNVYVPIYDSLLVLVSIIATAAILIRFAPRVFFGLCLALLVSSCFSNWLSSRTGWQILTPVLAAIGIFQMSACFRVSNESDRTLAGQASNRELTTG